MKILYGVVGEGLGHAMRSRVVLEHLIGAGHEVQVMASGRAVDFLSKRFSDVHQIHGYHMILEENRVRRAKTLWSNVTAGLTGTPKNIAAYFDLIDDFRAEAVISDFESWTWLYAKNHRLPVISIDNMQVINRCALDPRVIDGHEAEFQLTKAFVKAKLPFCRKYLITTFFRPPVRKPRTSLHAPILRPEILAATPTRGDHLLVYQTGGGDAVLIEALQATGIECRVYGVRRDLTEDVREGNLVYRPIGEKGFIADLASCRGVIASAGFTLMGEAVYLRKPMLAVPLARQFEQLLNARYLDLLGYGAWAPALDDPRVIADFVRALPRYEEALAGYTQDGNRALLAELDETLATAVAGGDDEGEED
ncbi:MAG: teichoic acid biosynthesis protein [Myxococcaceae bacterium]|nr:teichoic acid biosynthesis protein [Myxococcaceae bacterium]